MFNLLAENAAKNVNYKLHFESFLPHKSLSQTHDIEVSKPCVLPQKYRRANICCAVIKSVLIFLL